MPQIDMEKVKVENVGQMKFRDAQAKRTELLTTVNDYYKAKGDEPATGDEIKFVDAGLKAIEEIEQHISQQEEWKRLDERQKSKFALTGDPGPKTPPYEGKMGDAAKNAASVVLDNPEFKSWLEKVSSDGKGGFKPLADSDMIAGTGFPVIPFSKKDLVTDAMLTTGTLVRPDYKPLVDLGWPKLVMRDLMSVGTTNSSVVNYPRVNLRTNNAAVVPEATATGGSSGTKPESAWRIAPAVANVQTVAHWIPVTKSALADAGQLEMYLNNFLLNGLDQKVEEELIAGPGGSTHLLGLQNQVGILGQSPVAGADTPSSMINTALRAKVKVEDIGNRDPNGYLLNPNDWATVQLATAPGSGVFYYGGPAVIGPPRLWGLPVVTSHYQPQGSGFCGDFKQYALWDREQSNIKMTDGYMDFFIRNMVVILGEMRLANGILDANGICQIDFVVGPNS